jgi:hypothetical protein
MDAQNAPPDQAKPAEAANEALAAVDRASDSYNMAAPEPGSFAGVAGAGQGAPIPDYPVAAAQKLVSLAEQSAVYATRAFGPGTQRAYRSAWAKYTGWCAGHGLDPLAPPPGLCRSMSPTWPRAAAPWPRPAAAAPGGVGGARRAAGDARAMRPR